MSHHATPIACDLSALTEPQREEHEIVGHQVFGAVEEIQELFDGYAFRLPPESELLKGAAQFIAREKLCCPFFDFTVKLQRENGPMWLSITGRVGVKGFLEQELLPLVTAPVNNGQVSEE